MSPLVTILRILWLLLQVKNIVEMILNMRRNTWMLKMLDRYESLVVERVLSVQVTQAKQNQRHNIFHTKGVVKERSVCIIIDGESCNNLASMQMVEKLSLTTRSHPYPYYIQ